MPLGHVWVLTGSKIASTSCRRSSSIPKLDNSSAAATFSSTYKNKWKLLVSSQSMSNSHAAIWQAIQEKTSSFGVHLLAYLNIQVVCFRSQGSTTPPYISLLNWICVPGYWNSHQFELSTSYQIDCSRTFIPAAAELAHTLNQSLIFHTKCSN